jgi:hypothetical protein
VKNKGKKGKGDCAALLEWKIYIEKNKQAEERKSVGARAS